MIKYFVLFFILNIQFLYANSDNIVGIVKEIYFTPSNDCEKLLINNINNAKDNINIIIYSITDKDIVKALKDAYDRKIEIKIIADRLQSRNKSSKVKELIDYGIPITISKRYRIEHNKFSIIDDKLVITGSYNYTTNAKKYNSENCLLIEDNNFKYKTRFIELWNYYTYND